MTFEVDDADDEWVYPHPFCYIHSRFTAVCWTDPLSIIRKAFAALTPGGYYEMQDISGPFSSIDNTHEGTPIFKMANLVKQAFLQHGIDVEAQAMMEEVGFVDVKETVIEFPIGTWAKSWYHKTIGKWYQKDLINGIEGIMLGC